MVFDVTKASEWSYKGKVNIDTLEELKMFMAFQDSDVIIYRPTEDNPNYEIKIYDYYVE